MNSINDIKAYFNSLPEVKRIKELEGYIDNNKEINDCFNNIKEIQKKLINSKEFNQMNQYAILKKQYEAEKSKLFELPFVEEYFELLEYVNVMLNNFTNQVENKINRQINK